MSKPFPVFRYRIGNWRAYNRALINRGRLAVWFDEQEIAAWRNTEPAAGRVHHESTPISRLNAP